jgi:hypothetical protein
MSGIWTGRGKRVWLGSLCAILIALGAAAPAQGAADDPLFIFTPEPTPFTPPEPPPVDYFEGLCGLAVDSAGNFYVSDYYHDAVDVYTPSTNYTTQLAINDPLDGPCGIGLDSGGRLYVNGFHRDLMRFTPSSFPPTAGTGFGAGTVIDPVDSTGVAVDLATDDVYVNDRTYVAVYSSSGAPVLDGGVPLKIGLGSLGDAYGLAVSGGRVYVPDAADDTVKVYDPAISKVSPVAVIDGHGVAAGHFTSLRDAAIAVDRVSGKVYVADNLQPQFTEEPEAAIYVFSAAGAYLGRLRDNVVDGEPPGLAVDNSAQTTQGRVYVTSGNTEIASVYAYGPGAETTRVIPAFRRLAVTRGGSGAGAVTSSLGGLDCAAACEGMFRTGATVTLTARPDPGSSFAGWSGGGCSGTGPCTVTISASTAVEARFDALPGVAAGGGGSSGSGAASASAVSQKGAVRLSVDGRLSPRRLPRRGAAPISVAVAWRVATTDGSPAPTLRKLRIEINRHGQFDYAGLPICPYDRIQPASSARALTACRAALVGEGSFTAAIALEGQEPYDTHGRLLVFNGSRHGKHVLLGHIYSPHPFATSFVISFAVDELGPGEYGTALSATLPPALASWGNLTAIEMKLGRRYSSAGERHSFISAGCPAPKGFPGVAFPLTRTNFAFVGGLELTSTVTRRCQVR